MEYSMSSFKSLVTNIYLVKRIFKASGYTPNRTLISKIFKDLSCLQRIAAQHIIELVNKILQKIVVDISEKEDMKAPAESKMFSWEELGGMFASDKSDKELRDEYLEEKYGI